jgi:hypothetical protein
MQPIEPTVSVGLVETLKSAESAIEWARQHPDLTAAKENAIKDLSEALKRFRDSRIDPAIVQAATSALDRLRTRFGDSQHALHPTGAG